MHSYRVVGARCFVFRVGIAVFDFHQSNLEFELELVKFEFGITPVKHLQNQMRS